MEIKSIDESIVFSGNTFTKRVLFADKQVLSFVLNLQAGQALPSHKHEKSTVVLNVLSGCGEIKINDELGRLEKGSVSKTKRLIMYKWAFNYGIIGFIHHFI